MSVPIMFVFDLIAVLTSPGAYFLPRNFAHGGLQPLDGDAHFAELNFDYIYHDSGTNSLNREAIHDARMAEVVVDRPISLARLRGVVCRTNYEANTLRSMLPAGLRGAAGFHRAERLDVYEALDIRRANICN